MNSVYAESLPTSLILNVSLVLFSLASPFSSPSVVSTLRPRTLSGSSAGVPPSSCRSNCWGAWMVYHRFSCFCLDTERSLMVGICLLGVVRVSFGYLYDFLRHGEVHDVVVHRGPEATGRLALDGRDDRFD